ncbi:hypothetical protein M407DRAFT_247171 [Tulasnella calospora MUT 4182]|uniref:Uncharacterized protein n=1 Tax=Tulasnella calospora MUT 4182 TaxID=1051891 RepID=A0A0C3Q0W2_9AGAM|nr:hypothetical protein M407DRAFT_247171 [Tulasnella calospora MUT 4182]
MADFPFWGAANAGSCELKFRTFNPDFCLISSRSMSRTCFKSFHRLNACCLPVAVFLRSFSPQRIQTSCETLELCALPKTRARSTSKMVLKCQGFLLKAAGRHTHRPSHPPMPSRMTWNTVCRSTIYYEHYSSIRMGNSF